MIRMLVMLVVIVKVVVVLMVMLVVVIVMLVMVVMMVSDSLMTQETSLSPLLWLLMPLIGLAVTIPLIVTENYSNIWMAWTFPQNSTVLPLYIYYWCKRQTELRKTLRDWNR